MRQQSPYSPSAPLSSAWLFFAWTVMIVLGTTLPWTTMHPHAQWSRIDWTLFHRGTLTARMVLDMAINVAMYLPFGYLCRQWMRQTSAPMNWGYMLSLAAALSCCTEFLQIFNATRFPAVADLVMNLVGALVGSWAVVPGQDENRSLALGPRIVDAR